ncbi:MAG: HAD family hydrolase [Elusimicrobiota bacterium]|jgi:putative hydrolase of the HAD superfamily
MISAILFDWGGTLDSDGLHWLDRFYEIYSKTDFKDISKPKIKEAFYWADAQAEKDPSIRTAGLREMMDRHVRWQFEKLGLKDPKQAIAVAAAFWKPSERILRRNRRILENLSYHGIRLGIISNFYGNIETLCREFRFFSHLKVILDSAVVGMYKPDPKIFSFALEKLGLPAEQVAFVGDSFERDIVPAKSIGMRTYWLIGDQNKTPPSPHQTDGVLCSLEDLPRELLKTGQAV